MSSRQALWRSRAALSRVVRRASSRSVSSRSTIRPSRSSKLRSLISGVACCSPSALIIPCSRRACSLSSVGLGSMFVLLFQSVVVAGATQVDVLVGQQRQVLLGQWQSFQTLAQDRFEAFVTACAQCQRTLASGFQPLFAVLFAQAQDAQAGTEAVLRMDSSFKDVGDDASGVGPRLLCPADQPLRCPLGMFAVALGHMLGLSGVAAFVWRAQVAGHTLVGMETLDGLRRQPHFELVLHQLVWH